MRVTRAKQYRRHLRFFRIVYDVAPPYKVILDGNFIHACISSKVDIEQRLASVLQGAKFQLYVPRAAREELKALGPEFEKAYKFAIGRCRGLPPTPGKSGGGGSNDSGAEAATTAAEEEANMDPAKEILATIGTGNAGKYLVASQDENLRVRLRRVPGCPLVFVSRTVLLMEQPSGKSKAEFEKAERKKTVGTTDEEARVLDILKRREREEREKDRELQPRKRLKKKASAPNPLSCRRPKAAGAVKGGKGAAAASSAVGGNRTRRRRKTPPSTDGGGA